MRQTYSDWELLVVGDSCTDDTEEVVAQFGDARIHYRNLQENCGDQSGPNNAALRMATGRYLAYLNHDVDDCTRAGFIHADDIPDECGSVLGDRYSTRISTMVRDVIEQSEAQSEICVSGRVAAAMDRFKEFLWEWVYHSPAMLDERERVRLVVESLFELYMKSDEAYEARLGPVPETEALRARAVCDYVAGMTDRYAADRYVENFLPGAAPLAE